MKYLRLFESEVPDFKYVLGRYFDKIKPASLHLDYMYYDREHRHEPALALKRRDNYHPVIVVRISGVADKQQRTFNEKTKLKVTLDYCFDFKDVVKDRDFIISMREFLVNVFKKYAYFDREGGRYYRPDFSLHYFFINKSDIPKIMKELEEDFEIFKDSKNYNL